MRKIEVAAAKRSNAMTRSKTPEKVDDVLFDLLAEEDRIAITKFWAGITSTGIRLSDPRLKECRRKLKEIEKVTAVENDEKGSTVDRKTFKRCISENLKLILKAYKRDLVIPEFSDFTAHVESICENCKRNCRGKVATSIPQLARISPELWGVSICTVDGQRYSYGDCAVPFCLQSVCQPLNYALAISDVGAARVHEYVGQEPSGMSYNHLTLDHNKKPHNPLINSGSIVTNTLLKPNAPLSDKYDFVFEKYKKMAGNEYVGFSNSTYLSEKNTSDRNFALGHYMKEYRCFPSGTDLRKTMEFYFQMCSIETTTKSASVIAATFANGGICPITGEKVLANEAVRNTLSVMYSCGMHEYSGQFAFEVGLPAKSGVSGVVMLVVPNVMGICCYSPALDATDNSCRGVQFCEELVNVFNFHNYDYWNPDEKLDPRKRKGDKESNTVLNLLFSAAAGDVTAIRRFASSGMDLEATDYDNRTALHVAAAEGHENVAVLLLEKYNVNTSPKDRWGRTPLDDAVKFGHSTLADYLKEFENKTKSKNRMSRSKSTADVNKPEREKCSSGYSSKSDSPNPEDDM